VVVEKNANAGIKEGIMSLMEQERESMSVREGGKAVILIACTELKQL